MGLGQCHLTALLAVLTDNGRGRLEANADRAVLVDIRALGRNAADDILGSHRFGWRFTSHRSRPCWPAALCFRSREQKVS
jgi:hypothetical protein